MRTMWDSTRAADIPANVGMVAGYVDGLYRWSAQDWARFPDAIRVRIAVFPQTDDGHVLDVEKGNATPAQAPGWVAMRRRAGVDPSVYCSRSAWSQLAAQFQVQRVPGPHWWIADYTGAPHLPPGAVACQYADQSYTGAHFDLSEVSPYWPGVDPPPPPVPTRKVPEMIIVTVDGTTVPKGTAWPGDFTWNGSTLAHIDGDPKRETITNLLRALGQSEPAVITYRQYQDWIRL